MFTININTKQMLFLFGPELKTLLANTNIPFQESFIKVSENISNYLLRTSYKCVFNASLFL